MSAADDLLGFAVVRGAGLLGFALVRGGGLLGGVPLKTALGRGGGGRVPGGVLFRVRGRFGHGAGGAGHRGTFRTWIFCTIRVFLAISGGWFAVS